MLAKNPGGKDSRTAYVHLCSNYWRPLYAFTRQHGFDPEDSRDLVQQLMARFWEKQSLRDVDPKKGRFRTLLLTSMSNLLKDEHARRATKKRNTKDILVSIDISEAENYYQEISDKSASPEMCFDRQWVLTILRDGYDSLKEDFERKNQGEFFEIYAPYLTNDDAAPYSALSNQTGKSQTAIRSAVHRLRSKYQTEIRRRVADTVSTSEAFDDELAYLLDLFEMRATT